MHRFAADERQEIHIGFKSAIEYLARSIGAKEGAVSR
jgi:hypothetical protein